MLVDLTARQTLIIAILVLFGGKYLTRHIVFLRRFNIPEPVTGGFLVSLILSAIYFVADIEFRFDLAARDNLLIVFFTTIGLSARVEALMQGGRALLVLIFAAVVYLVLQNVTGLGVTAITGLPSVAGLVGGSVSLSGGHGTSIAWAPLLASQFGFNNALEVGIACATFGLVLGGLLGGPIAGWLIKRHGLEATPDGLPTVGIPYDQPDTAITVDTILSALLVICLAIGLGLHLEKLMVWLGLKLPTFVNCLMGGIILTNILPRIFRKWSWPAGTSAMSLISDLSLGLFLAMSLMSLQLWVLLDLAGPIFLLLMAQVVVITLFVVLLVFRLLGSDYDAAVMAAGYAGMGLGATPTAIANMTAVTLRFGASAKAFVVVPLVGAFFIDIANAVIIQAFLEALS